MIVRPQEAIAPPVSLNRYDRNARGLGESPEPDLSPGAFAADEGRWRPSTRPAEPAP